MTNNQSVSARWMIAIVLTLLTFCGATTLLSARFVSEAGGNTQVSVASFDVTATEASSPTLSIDLSGSETTAEYQFNVTNHGDVSIIYDVTVILPEHTADGLIISIGTQSQTVSSGVTDYTFENVGTLSYGSETQICSVIFDATNLSENVTLNGISLSVTATQID